MDRFVRKELLKDIQSNGTQVLIDKSPKYHSFQLIKEINPLIAVC